MALLQLQRRRFPRSFTPGDPDIGAVGIDRCRFATAMWPQWCACLRAQCGAIGPVRIGGGCHTRTRDQVVPAACGERNAGLFPAAAKIVKIEGACRRGRRHVGAKVVGRSVEPGRDSVEPGRDGSKSGIPRKLHPKPAPGSRVICANPFG